MALRNAAQEARSFLCLRELDALRVPNDVVDLVALCKRYQTASLEHEYRCRRLAEYILHLHTMHLDRAAGLSLPPIPAEIAWYVNVHRERASNDAADNY